MKKNIYLAGGCFWGVEGYFRRVTGILDTKTGYANGNTLDTDYNRLKETDHAETVKISYDDNIISLEEILLRYFSIINPESLNRQGPDKGRQYRTGIFYVDDKDLSIIKKIIKYEESFYKNIVVLIEKLENFVLGEEYHQRYLEKNPRGYCHINLEKARNPIFLKESKAYEDEFFELPFKSLKEEEIDEESINILKHKGTERPFSSEFNKEDRKGIYVDKVTGDPLFSSRDKFDSGCGWPSFSKMIMTNKGQYIEDNSHGMNRIEVKSMLGNNHLGHVFDDGPVEKGSLRYCINGKALRFIPYEKLDEEGYSDYKVLFPIDHSIEIDEEEKF